MKNLVKFFVYTALFLGCNITTTVHNQPTWIDPELQPLVQDWINDCKKHINPKNCNTEGIVSIKQVDKYDNANVLGECEINVEYFKEFRYITVLKKVNLNTYRTKALLLHEMMHCRFKFERHENVGVMGEIMQPFEFYYKNNWEKLLKKTYELVK